MGRVRTGEKLALLLAVSFFVLCALRFWLVHGRGEPWQVSGTKNETAAVSQVEQAQWPESLLPGERIDLNTAPAAELSRLPQIGENRARAIVTWREKHGPFRTAGQLMKVPGISRELFGQISEYVTVSDTD